MSSFPDVMCSSVVYPVGLFLQSAFLWPTGPVNKFSFDDILQMLYHGMSGCSLSHLQGFVQSYKQLNHPSYLWFVGAAFRENVISGKISQPFLKLKAYSRVQQELVLS